MYIRNLVILANSIKYQGHCIAGKDLDTGEWVRLINNHPGPFSESDLQRLFGDPKGPSLLTCLKVPFEKKDPLYFQPENEVINGEPWERTGDFPKEKISSLEDRNIPCWLEDPTFGFPDRIPLSVCKSDLPLSVSLHFMRLKKVENSLGLAYKQHDSGIKPRLIFYLNNQRFDLGISDITYPRFQTGEVPQTKSISDCYVTIGIGQLYEKMNAHYKLVVGILHSNDGILQYNGGISGNISSETSLPPDHVSPSTQTGNILEQMYQLDVEISALKNKIDNLTLRKKGLLDQALSAAVVKQGNYRLYSYISRVRKLNLEAFKQLYPKEFMEIGIVRLTDADKIIGRTEVTKICTHKESIRYGIEKVTSEGEKEENADE